MDSPLRLGVALNPSSSGAPAAIETAQLVERLGYSSVWTGEAYGFDAVVPLAWVAAHTSTITVGTSIMQIPGRTPAMTAMTALSMAELSGGRFVLGLGLSGPRVAEGWHGVAADRPLRRTSEYLDLVGQILRGDAKVQLGGAAYQVPYQGEGATGLGDPLRPLATTDHHVPIMLAAIGPLNVKLAVAEADGLLPILWSPTRWSDIHGTDLFDLAGADFEVVPRVWVALGDDLARCRDEVRPRIAFYVGAMGPPDRNYYAEVVRRYGFEEAVDAITRCFAERRPSDAAAHVPDELVDDLALVGPRSHIAQQLEMWRRLPVATTLVVDSTDEPTLTMLADLVL